MRNVLDLGLLEAMRSSPGRSPSRRTCRGRTRGRGRRWPTGGETGTTPTRFSPPEGDTIVSWSERSEGPDHDGRRGRLDPNRAESTHRCVVRDTDQFGERLGSLRRPASTVAAMAQTFNRGPVTGTAQAAAKKKPFLLDLYGTAVGKKYVMAITGIMLMGFVLAHMIGNLKMYLGAEDLNHYAEFLRELLVPILPRTVVLWLMRLGLIGAVLLHIHAAYALTRLNRQARSVKYQSARDYQVANFASRTMRWTGIIVALFSLWHLADLTWGCTNDIGRRRLRARRRRTTTSCAASSACRSRSSTSSPTSRSASTSTTARGASSSRSGGTTPASTSGAALRHRLRHARRRRQRLVPDRRPRRHRRRVRATDSSMSAESCSTPRSPPAPSPTSGTTTSST